MIATMKPFGTVKAQITRAKPAPLAWKISNYARAAFIKSWLAIKLIRPVARWFGLMTAFGTLEARVRKASGEWVNYGVLSYRVVTNNGVGFIVDAFQNIVELEIMKYHGVGTGNTAEAAADSALVTESTTVLNPDSTRGTGTTTESASNAYQTVGTVTFDGSAAIVEHGIFSQAATGGGVLLDRSVFSAINVASGDSIQFTYTLTVTAGG
jgi:hypothetical protein